MKFSTRNILIVSLSMGILVVMILVVYLIRKSMYKASVKKILENSGIKNMPRVIDKIIIHCSATKPKQNCTVEVINEWHKARGFSCIGYHYVIYEDGSIHTGRPVKEIGAHTSGQNANSIGICYIGGLDANGKPKDTRTLAQKNALRTIVDSLIDIFPQAKVYGHRDFANKACPCFDVKTQL